MGEGAGLPGRPVVPIPEPGEDESRSGIEGRKHLRGSTALLSGRLLSMLFTVTTQVVIVRALSKTEFGAFAFALAITSACRTLMSLGQGKSVSRFLAMYDEQRDYNRLFGTMVITGATILLSSAFLILVVFLGQEAISTTFINEPVAKQALLILVFLAPLEALDEVFVSFFAVFARVRSIFVRRYVLTPILRLTVVVLVMVSGGGAIPIAVGYLGGQLVGTILYVVLLVKVLRERNLLHQCRLNSIILPWRAVLSFSFPMLSNELVYLSMQTGSVLLLSYYWGAQQVAEYRAVFPAARMNQIVYTAFLTLYLPMASRLFARGDRDGTRETYWHTAVFLAVLSFPVFAMTGPFAAVTTVALFGERYAASSVVLLLLSLGYYLNVCLGLNAQTLQVFGRVKYLLWVNVISALLNVLLALFLIPHVGILGVAIANASTLLVQNFLNQWALRAIVGSFLDRRYVRPYVIIVFATAALAVFDAVVSPPLSVALPVAALASVAVLIFTRKQLRLGETFPEVLRIPLLSRLLQHQSPP